MAQVASLILTLTFALGALWCANGAFLMYEEGWRGATVVLTISAALCVVVASIGIAGLGLGR